METNNTTTSNGVQNSHTKDNAAKIVFGDPVLCAQFLKGYTDIPLFKEIKPEDIENVSSHFLPLFQESRDSDTVNKIRIGDSEIYLLHSSSINRKMILTCPSGYSATLYLSGQIMLRNRKSYIKASQNPKLFFIHQSCLSYIMREPVHGLHR